MKIAIFSCRSFEMKYLKEANTNNYQILLIEKSLNKESVREAKGCTAISIFSSDKIDKEMLKNLVDLDIGLITTRSAGTNHIDLKAAEKLGIKITNVPEYSPHAIAEHCIALTLAIYRKLKRSFERVKDYNFDLSEQVGTEIYDKKVGICGTGEIGEVLANLFQGFGASIYLFDIEKNLELSNKSWATYVDKETLLKECDIISLNLPLNKETHHFITENDLNYMKKSAILINTGRGGLVDTKQVYEALQNKKIAGFGMDVYENEEKMFYEDHSKDEDKDELLMALIAMDNVLVTAHQAFLTKTALENIMRTTFENLEAFYEDKELENKVYG